MRKIDAIVLSMMLLLLASCSGKTNGPDVEIKAEDPFMTAAISPGVICIRRESPVPCACISSCGHGLTKSITAVRSKTMRIICDIAL